MRLQLILCTKNMPYKRVRRHEFVFSIIHPTASIKRSHLLLNRWHIPNQPQVQEWEREAWMDCINTICNQWHSILFHFTGTRMRGELQKCLQKLRLIQEMLKFPGRSYAEQIFQMSPDMCDVLAYILNMVLKYGVCLPFPEFDMCCFNNILLAVNCAIANNAYWNLLTFKKRPTNTVPGPFE